MTENKTNHRETNKIIYIFDALCPWCYAFTPVVKTLYDSFKKQFEFEMISGGLVQKNDMVPSDEARRSVSRKDYKTIADQTGISFGEPFFKLAAQEGIVQDSEVPATALAVFREIDSPYPDIAFVSELMAHIYMKGFNPGTDTIYKKLAENFHLDSHKFIALMKDDYYKQRARYDFALAKQLRAEAFPRLYLQTSATYFHLIAKGYSDYDTIVNIINRIQASR